MAQHIDHCDGAGVRKYTSRRFGGGGCARLARKVFGEGRIFVSIESELFVFSHGGTCERKIFCGQRPSTDRLIEFGLVRRIDIQIYYICYIHV